MTTRRNGVAPSTVRIMARSVPSVACAGLSGSALDRLLPMLEELRPALRVEIFDRRRIERDGLEAAAYQRIEALHVQAAFHVVANGWNAAAGGRPLPLLRHHVIEEQAERI